MTLVLVGKSIVLRGLASKIEVIWVLGMVSKSSKDRVLGPLPNGRTHELHWLTYKWG